MMNAVRALAWAGAGFAVTPLLEYAWHRRVAHGRAPHPTRDTHQEHHRTANTVMDPWEEMRQTAPLLGQALLGVGAALGLAVGLRRSIPLAAGLAAGYAFSTLYHARMHQRAPQTAYERWMWRFHWHHHAEDARENFGLTNPVFDYLFGSATAPESVEVPERFAPEWLRREGECAGIRIRGRAVLSGFAS